MDLSNDSIISLLDDSISCLSTVEKAAYFEAVEKAPGLVLQETDPIDFLQLAQFNAWEAVQRLSNYWKWKKKLFDDRWLLPIHDISGTGALDSKDLSLLLTGYVINLPADKDGNSVILLDRSRVGQKWHSLDPIQNLRLYFYTVAVAAKNQKLSTNKTNSYVFLNLVFNKPNLRSSKDDLADVFSNTSPIQLKSIHTIILTKRDKINIFTRFVVPFICRNVLYMFSQSSRTYSLLFSKENAQLTLESYGLRSDCFPPTLGGTWDYSNFYEILPLVLQPSKPSIFDVICNQKYPSGPNSCEPSVQRPSMDNDLLITQSSGVSVTSSSCHLTENAPFVHVTVGDRSLDGSRNSDSKEIIAPKSPSGSTVVVPSLIRKQKESMDLDLNEDIVIDTALDLNILLYNNFDSIKVVDQQASHIKLRRSLFGNRSSLQLNQTTAGALNDDDVATLNSGYLMILPNDKCGNFVLLLEPSKADGCSTDSIRRCYFYILHILSEEVFNKLKTITLLAIMNNIQHFETWSTLTLADISAVFPVDFSFFHAFVEPTENMTTNHKSTAAENLLSRLFQPWKGQVFTHILSTNPASFFISHDIDTSKLPLSLGGTWTFSCFQRWQEERLAIEMSKSCAMDDHSLHKFSDDELVTNKECFISEPLSDTMEQRLKMNNRNQQITNKRYRTSTEGSETSSICPNSDQSVSTQSTLSLFPVPDEGPGSNFDDFSCTCQLAL